MCKSRKKYNIGSNQSGVVSIFVTLIIMIILSIVVIGFSQISRREARAALDRQLSTQAFYAAESGINDAYSIVNKAIGTPLGPIPATSQCNSPSYINGTSNQIDPTTNTASYTCLLVNVQPTYLTFLPQTGQAVIADLAAAGTPAPTFKSLNIDWENDINQLSIDDAGGGCLTRYSVPTGTNSFLPNANWSPATTTCPPVLQIDIVPVILPTSELALSGSVKTFFLKPHINGGSASWSSITNGAIEAANCSTLCQFSLTGMDTAAGGPNAQEYYIKIMYIYGLPPTINLTATDTKNQPINFKNSQIQVDSTGKSEGVLRRIKVVLPLKPASVLSPPSFAIQTNTSLCKRIEVGNSGGSDFGFLNIPILPAATPQDILGVMNTGSYNLDTISPYNFTTAPQSTTNSCDPY